MNKMRPTLLTLGPLTGGNDAGLEDILNHCIFQWASFNQEQATVAKLEEIREKMMKEATKSEWIESVDWDKLSRGCDGQLEFTNSVINSDDFSKSIDSVLEAAKAKLSSE